MSIDRIITEVLMFLCLMCAAAAVSYFMTIAVTIIVHHMLAVR
jgi:hypothetical protein